MNKMSEYIVQTMQKILVILIVIMTASCATIEKPAPLSESQQITTRMLLELSPLLHGAEPVDLSQIDVLELNPEMIEFMDRWVDNNEGDYARLRRLLYAVMGDGTFEVIYDDETRTARETFLDQRGNCLSFTSMFVAMARYVGLDANYQEVTVPPDWSVSGQTFILSKHVNVHVRIDQRRDQMIDFNMADVHMSYDRKVISDGRGRAHYFNNKGVELMLEGDTSLAFANFLQSLKEDMSFAPAWINLGILYGRNDYPNYAEAAYLEALDHGDSSLVAMNNLAALYTRQGHSELAAYYQGLIETHRMQNPYYRYHLARNAFENGDYATAIDHLNYAIRKNKNDDTFYFLMSLSYLNIGEKESAQRWMKKAEEVAEMSTDKRKYHNKLDLLMSDSD